MEENNIEGYRGRKSSRIWSGLILLAVGSLLLAYKMGAPIPGWLFTWPVLLIAIGLLVGFKSKFRNPGSLILILIGAVFLLDQLLPGIDFHNYILPVILIALGIVFILTPKRSSCHHRRSRRFARFAERYHEEVAGSENFSSGNNFEEEEDGEFINVHAVFGGIKKNITSKNFKGGEIVSFMGGSEINFMQADIQEPVSVEVNNVFGGTKLIIPSSWDVKNEISALFGGVEDKRNFNTSTTNSNKRILLKGACVFGGIEVTNY